MSSGDSNNSLEFAKIPRSVGTHDGTFHADEVTACALLLLFDLVDSNKIIRTRQLDQLIRCEYVCDVGGIYDPELKLFDHHQVDYQGPLSSAGMVLLHLKETEVITPQEYDFFNNALILGVDAHDNGKDVLMPGIATYSQIVSNYTPITHDSDPKVLEDAFCAALKFAFSHLSRLWERYRYNRSCREIVAQRMKESNVCLIFDKSIPWLESFFELGGEQHPALYVIMPSGKHWKLRCIPPNFINRMKVRKPLPESWAGLLDEDLKKVSGIPGAIFCHKGRFISVWETKEDALTALAYVLHDSQNGEQENNHESEES